MPGYAILADDDQKDLNNVREKLKAKGIDGLISMKITDDHTESVYGPDVTGDLSFYNNYYDRAGAIPADPVFAETEVVLGIETDIYTVADGKRLWSSTSDTFDPKNIRTALTEVAKVVKDELYKEKSIEVSTGGSHV